MDDHPIPDVQNSQDTRNIPIDKVGIKSLRHPVKLAERAGGVQHSVGVFNMTVSLPAHFKGTHMSRFVEILENNEREISSQSFEGIVREMAERLDAQAGEISMQFPYFVSKKAPVTGVKSLLDYQITFIGSLINDKYRFTMKVEVPVTSLCPCSREISRYGAHNQRSHVTITARTTKAVWIEELIDIVEKQASCELYGLLKRPDEKFVTERAYDNPKFVEDMVRDVAAALDQDERVLSFTVESENFESIHNHSAYALIEREKPRK